MAGRIVYLSDVPPAGESEMFEGVRDVLSVPDVADLLGVAPATVRREIARGALECVHVGARVKITKKQLWRDGGDGK